MPRTSRLPLLHLALLLTPALALVAGSAAAQDEQEFELLTNLGSLRITPVRDVPGKDDDASAHRIGQAFRLAAQRLAVLDDVALHRANRDLDLQDDALCEKVQCECTDPRNCVAVSSPILQAGLLHLDLLEQVDVGGGLLEDRVTFSEAVDWQPDLGPGEVQPYWRNSRGTLALLRDESGRTTREWIFNVVDNSDLFDPDPDATGPERCTSATPEPQPIYCPIVFAVVNSADWALLDQIATYGVYDGRSDARITGPLPEALDQLPLEAYDGVTSEPALAVSCRDPDAADDCIEANFPVVLPEPGTAGALAALGALTGLSRRARRRLPPGR